MEGVSRRCRSREAFAPLGALFNTPHARAKLGTLYSQLLAALLQDSLLTRPEIAWSKRFADFMLQRKGWQMEKIQANYEQKAKTQSRKLVAQQLSKKPRLLQTQEKLREGAVAGRRWSFARPPAGMTILGDEGLTNKRAAASFWKHSAAQRKPAQQNPHTTGRRQDLWRSRTSEQVRTKYTD